MTSMRRDTETPGLGDTAVTEADEQSLRAALDGLCFPADRHAMLAYAIDRGDLENHLLDALDAVPDRTFSSIDDAIISLPDRA